MKEPRQGTTRPLASEKVMAIPGDQLLGQSRIVPLSRNVQKEGDLQVGKLFPPLDQGHEDLLAVVDRKRGQHDLAGRVLDQLAVDRRGIFRRNGRVFRA